MQQTSSTSDQPQNCFVGLVFYAQERAVCESERYLIRPPVHVNGGTQGTVITPAMFTTYTDELRGSDEDSVAIKFADDIAVQDFQTAKNILN